MFYPFGDIIRIVCLVVFHIASTIIFFASLFTVQLSKVFFFVVVVAYFTLKHNLVRLFLSFFLLNANREIEACCHLLASLCSCLEQIMIIREKSEHGSLFPPGEHKAIGLFNTSASVNQYSFYGRCIGFHVS